MKIVVSFIFMMLVGFFVFSSISSVHAQGLTECDACGYCYASGIAPGNWDSCRSCLYPEADGPTPGGPTANNKTLERNLNPQTGLIEQITKAPGKYYTQLGCIDVGMDSFDNPSAPGGVLNFMLTRVIFPTVGALSFMALLYGSFLFLTAQSNPDQIAKGKSYIIGAIVGLIFTLSVILIINTIAGDILRIPGFTKSGSSTMDIRGFSAIQGGQTISPILGVYVNGKEVDAKTLTDENQSININLPAFEKLEDVSFTLKNDLCNSIGSPEQGICCACALNEIEVNPQDRESWRQACQKTPLSQARIQECRDRQNQSGDVNIVINKISIEGKECTSFTVDNIAASAPIAIYNDGVHVRCTSVKEGK